MSADEESPRQSLFASGEEMLRLMKLGVYEAMRDHIRKGVPAITWDSENNRIVEIPADQIAAEIRKTDPDFEVEPGSRHPN